MPPCHRGKMILTVFSCQVCGSRQGCREETSGEENPCSPDCGEKCKDAEKFLLFEQKESVKCFGCQLNGDIEYSTSEFEHLKN